MALRFTTTDPAAAAEATAKIPHAVYRLDRVMSLAQENLQDAKPLDTPIAHVLLFIGRMTAARAQVDQARAELILLLAQTGVPARKIAEAFGVHHSTVTKAIKAAQSAARMSAAVAADDESQAQARRRDEEYRKKQEQDSREGAD